MTWMSPLPRFALVLCLCLGYAWAAGGATPDAGHAAGIVNVLFGIVVVLLAAMLGGEVTERFGRPAVLGELAAGIALGNLGLIGFAVLDPLKTNQGHF